MDVKKIQMYFAADEEEYEKALNWCRENNQIDEIKEVGLMKPDLMDTYVFAFVASDEVIMELARYMKQPFKFI